MKPHAAPALLAAAALSLAGGCTTNDNDRSYTGVVPPSPEANADVAYDPGHGLDRDQWGTTTFDIPVDGTAHKPTYNANIRYSRDTTRQRGEFPTAEQALELEPDSRRTQIKEVPVQLGSAVFDAASVPFGLVTYHQGNVRWSPDVSYERTPESARERAAAVAADAQTASPSAATELSEGASPGASVPPASDSVPEPTQAPMGRMTPVESGGEAR